MRTSRAMSIAASVTLLLAASAVLAVNAFAGDHDHHHDHDKYRESREYPHIHGDWRKPYIPPRTHDSGTRYDDDSYHLDDDDSGDRRTNTDYLSDDESDE